ncbi:ABC transporter ATP-binding protein [Lentzea flaviverrucosa]|uniref:Branched-chain amino acid transport system ATP-binding protein n=1 Tax=Lentzea flaviverrucosa TaxID=200379 RepID=A0A1H9K286_9PSEU|nr:ABC transporter ATP-binding protein [Lentzea flaviverrucosa]RDI26718.1 amino acid/amide ABC transporter ATP-binding protein 2 (HAAT family) [Lentzea flaviverrucosa]SEQ93214.1 branched-chain amino acid transport system ATP-binding protein [Lentzea flaviverrucosa]
MIDLKDVHAGYGRIEVLRGVSLTVPRGTVTALLGPNGAGKSTLVKVLSGQIRATSGHVHLGGVHVNDAAPDELARAGLCTVPEGRAIFPNLTVAENLRLMRGDAELVYRRFPKLKARHGQLAGSMSGGEQQMLAFSRALITDPAVLVIDELSMGLAPVIVAELYEVVGELARSGVTMLVVEQFAETASAVADQVVVMTHGEISADDDLATVYFGGTS